MRWFFPNIRLLRAVLLPAILGATLPAQDPGASRAPLSSANVATADSEGGMTLAAAQRAQDFGLPLVAADVYRQLREQPGVDRTAVNLALVTTLLDAGLPDEAEKVLAEIPPPHNAAWRLRSGLAAFQRGQRAAAQSQWDSIREEEVPALDRPWYWFFTGALYDTATPRDVPRANTAYTKAETEAATELAKARFQLAGELVRLEDMGVPSADVVEQARRTYEQERGKATGNVAAEQYAAKLDMAGRKNDAEQFLREILLSLPRHETAWRDKFNFLLGLIGNRGRSAAARAALTQLLETGLNPQRQRQALQLLAEASREEPARREFKNELTKLISARTPHPILESLYYFRAQFALADREYIQAEEDANAVLKQFPLSPIRVHALVILTQAAWEQGRYRVAAEMARKARNEMAPPAAGATAAVSSVAPKPAPATIAPRLRANLGVLEAEARFRAKDYRSAADAYAALLTERPPELETRQVGALMFQHVLAEIKAGSGDAPKVLDQHESDAAFDMENRWQAEWSLARALQVQGAEGAGEAFKRVTALLQESQPSAGAMNPELRAKMAWLQVKLAFDSGDFAGTIRLADELIGGLAELEKVLRNEISSTLLLFKAQSEFALAREPAAIETLKRLRAEFAANDAAIQSHLIEAEYFAAQDKIDEARNRLIALTDNTAYKNSRYVPYALYWLAVLSERLGRKENLEEANQRIEDLVKTPAAVADPTLYFAARMRQGDIFRKLNNFSKAQLAYEDLVTRYAQHPDVVLAQLALADCYSLQSSAGGEGGNPPADSARLIYERLLDRFDAPRDVRVEAGYKLGALLARTGKIEAAVKVWWSDVVDQFLVREKVSFEPGAKRPYWLARTLCELGELQEKRGRYEEAKAAYVLVLESRLPDGGAIASARLERLKLPAAKNGQ